MKINDETILSLLLKCKSMTQLKQLHGVMITSSVMGSTIHASKVVDYCTDDKSGELNIEYARSVFEGIAEPSLYIWNSMMRGYSNSDSPSEALITYRRLLRNGFSPDHFSFPFVLKACSAVSDIAFGTSVHNRVVKTGFGLGVHTSTALLHMYARCGDMESGLKVFDDIPKWSVVAWATLISGLVGNDRAGEAVRAFNRMDGLGIEPNEIATVNALVACARTGDIETGKRAHSLINALGRDPFSRPAGSGDFNVILASAIVDMYAKCGTLKTARELFDRMPLRNSVVWNSMIGAYSKYGRARESLELFREMKTNGPVPDQATFVVVAGACANIEAPSLGQSVHACAEKTRSRDDLTVGTTLVFMYSKTGDLGSARRVFDSLGKKDAEAWTTMILGLARHGHGSEALTAFESMKRDSDVSPDRITYIGVLSACGAVGLVEPGLGYLDEMRSVYGLVPEQEHYSCVVDLLSRAGRFEEAVRLVEEMPFEPNVVVWGALLNGCEIHENVELANRVRERLTELQPRGSGVYVLLSNIYARAGNWQAVNLARDLMRQRHIIKTLGLSMVPKTHE